MAISNSLASSGKKQRKKRAGFTLIEMIVATSILLILSGIMLTYSSSSRKAIELANNEATLMGLLFNAKAISQSFVLDSPDPALQICSYGVHIDDTAGTQRAFIFRDLIATGADCDNSDNIYTAGNLLEILPGAVNTFTLSNLLEYEHSSNPLIADLKDVVFIPPDPTTKINYLPTPAPVVESASIIIRTKEDHNSKFRIIVNRAGQISVE